MSDLYFVKMENRDHHVPNSPPDHQQNYYPGLHLLNNHQNFHNTNWTNNGHFFNFNCNQNVEHNFYGQHNYYENIYNHREYLNNCEINDKKYFKVNENQLKSTDDFLKFLPSPEPEINYEFDIPESPIKELPEQVIEKCASIYNNCEFKESFNDAKFWGSDGLIVEQKSEKVFTDIGQKRSNCMKKNEDEEGIV